MEPPKRTSLPYSWKNIPTPSANVYKRRLVEMVESVIRRMRWKAFFFLHGESGEETQESDEKYGLKSRKCPPVINELKPFEDDMLKLIESLEFRRTNDEFQKKLKSDIDSIRKSDAVLVPADKTRNLYQMDSQRYGKLLHDNVTKHYKHAPPGTYNSVNAEAQIIARNLKVADRMDSLARKEAFITLKDHKEDFLNKLPCRLINPGKSEIGIVSKRILDRVNVALVRYLRVQQWKNSSDVTTWFTSISEKDRCVFTCFDICEFYPSISEELLTNALDFARQFTDISDEEKAIILHSRKSLLFSAGSEWVKKNRSGLFDVTMGCYDGAEVCELVGTYALAKLPADKFERNYIGLYRDDGLSVHHNTAGRHAERIKKDLIKHFNALGLKITIQTNLRIANFLDLTLDLNCGKFFPYRKPNDNPTYIHRLSDHPPSIIRNIPVAISRRLTDISSDETIFLQAAPIYNSALKDSGYSESVSFLADRKDPRRRGTSGGRRRVRKVIWFNPPFSKNVKSRIGKQFLGLISRHFPKGSKLHKIFNRQTVKVSYSCMPNVASIIKSHNNRVLRSDSSSAQTGRAGRRCNCRNRSQCPLNGECLTSSIVYKAIVRAPGSPAFKEYIGLTEGPFKQRYNNHLTSFRHERHSDATELSKHIWELKRMGTDFTITWSVCRRAPAYSSLSKSCQLCLTEKLCIIAADKRTLLNKRPELISTCRHRRKHLLCNFDSNPT